MSSVSSSAIIIGAIIAIVGWGVSHFLTVRRDHDRFRREDLAREISIALSIVADLFEMCFDYHTDPRNIRLERKILIAIDRLSHRISNLPLTEVDADSKQAIANRAIDFKIAITGEHFESDHCDPLDAASEQLALCQHEAAQLEALILGVRRHCYTPQKFIVINYWTGSPS